MPKYWYLHACKFTSWIIFMLLLFYLLYLFRPKRECIAFVLLYLIVIFASAIASIIYILALIWSIALLRAELGIKQGSPMCWEKIGAHMNASTGAPPVLQTTSMGKINRSENKNNRSTTPERTHAKRQPCHLAHHRDPWLLHDTINQSSTSRALHDIKPKHNQRLVF